VITLLAAAEHEEMSRKAAPIPSESIVSKPNPFAPSHMKICYYLLSTGAVLFVLGAYTGFVLHLNSVLVFLILGVSIALFAGTFFVLLKQRKALPQPESGVEPQAESKARCDGDAQIVTLLNTSLGDLLLAALRKDPQGAQRIFAEAGVQVEAPSTVVPAGAAKDGSSA
jgi:hypothetical protein